MPDRSPKTSVLETRIDIRVIAELARFYDTAYRITISSKSELIRKCLVDYLEIIRRSVKGEMSRVATAEEAVEILVELGIGANSKGGRNREALLRELSTEILKDDNNALDIDVQRALEELDNE